ncbi:hypothetical protein E4U55_007818 [Claviceps digitariae]|nr:hypothetical protein E4U55_007818 [Claviceps digitariae]
MAPPLSRTRAGLSCRPRSGPSFNVPVITYVKNKPRYGCFELALDKFQNRITLAIMDKHLMPKWEQLKRSPNTPVENDTRVEL